MFQAIARLARNIKRPGNSTGWVQRQPQMSLHMGTVGTVDQFNNVADFNYNDPSNTTQAGVRVLLPYPTGVSPTEGDTVIAIHTGTDMWIIGQHVVPTPVVTPT